MPALHLSTILTREPSRLLAHVGDLARRYAGQGHTVLFTLSSNFGNPQDLQAAVNGLTKFNDIDTLRREGNGGKLKGHTVGCLSDSFSSTNFEAFPQLTSSKDDLLSCSIGIFDSSLCVPFRSALPGRTQPQVGRWHSFRKKSGITSSSGAAGQSWEPDWQNMDKPVNTAEDNDTVDWEAIWDRSSSASSSTPAAIELLPADLREVRPSQIRALFSLSSPHPDTFTNVLQSAFPDAPSLTLIAAPTHFITGRGVTLFMDGQIFDEGAVGIALLDEAAAKDKSEQNKLTSSTRFLDMTRLSDPMTITRREGNVINELNSSNPTMLLLRSLDHSKTLSSRPTFKDAEQFALGTVGPDGQILRTYRITAGDPSSRGGSISLDAPTAPPEGSVVQFLHIPGNRNIDIPVSFLPSSTSDKDSKKVLACVAVPEAFNSAHLHTSAAASESLSHVFEGTFLVPSTQGFVLAEAVSAEISSKTTSGTQSSVQASRSPWTCSLPGGAVILPVS